MSDRQVAEHPGSPPVRRVARSLAGLMGAAMLLVGAVSWVGKSSPGHALGPVLPITPVETSPPLGAGFDPDLSYRGETAGVLSPEVFGTTVVPAAVSFVLLDTGGADGSFQAEAIGVSDNGCRAAYTLDVGRDLMRVVLLDRCDPASSRVIAQFNGTHDSFGRPALSADGRFVAVEFTEFVVGAGSNQYLARIDTFNGDTMEVLPTAGLPGDRVDSQFGLDISDDGNVIAVTMREFPPILLHDRAGALGALELDMFVTVWEVSSGALRVVNDFGKGRLGDSAFPSVSGDGRFVAFANDAPLVGGEIGRGPWVYVHDRATGGYQLVSPPDASAIYTSITSDATQVAFGQMAAPCLIDSFVDQQCPPIRVVVVRSPVPGMTGGLQSELISTLPNGQPAGGEHHEPALSGNGQFIAWRTNVAGPLTGSRGPIGMHAVIRRRDPAMAVSAVDFGSITVGGFANATVTVSNTGTTTLNPFSFAPSSGSFVVQPGGSCFAGISLPPGGSCTLNVRFTAAPPAPATINASLTVSEAGYQPVAATGALVGRVIPPGVTTTTTSTTVPRNTPTTTTTIPLNSTFSADPNPVDFGQVAVGIATPAQTITVTNNGNGPFVFTTEMGGINPDDFFVSDNQCNGVTLQPAATCTITVIMIALDGGDRVAEIVIRAGGQSGSVELRGQGRFAPELVASPGAVGVAGSTVIIGQGFPPDRAYEVHVGTTGIVLPATADAAGRFVVRFDLPRSMGLGSYLLRVDALASVFEEVRGQLAVVLPTFEPQGQNGPVFGTTMIVTRGS